MTEEERQRQMDFIVEQQAQFAINIQQVQEQQTQFAEHMQQANNRTDRLERVAKLMVRAGLRARREMRAQDERITALIDSQIKTDDALRELSNNLTRTEEITNRNSESIAALVAATESNSETINQLAEIVRQLATRPNGNGKF